MCAACILSCGSLISNRDIQLALSGDYSNSNTMADKRLQQTGIVPPNTGTANVPGGMYDRDTSPWDALLNTLTQKLNQANGTVAK